MVEAMKGRNTDPESFSYRGPFTGRSNGRSRSPTMPQMIFTKSSSDSGDDNKTMLQAYKDKDNSKGKNESNTPAKAQAKAWPRCYNRAHYEGCPGLKRTCKFESQGDLEKCRAEGGKPRWNLKEARQGAAACANENQQLCHDDQEPEQERVETPQESEYEDTLQEPLEFPWPESDDETQQMP